MEKKKFRFHAVLVLLVVVSLAACGGGGGNINSGIGNTMTVVVSGATTTYTEGAINNYGYFDPDMEADIDQVSGRTWIFLSSGVGVPGSTLPTTLINVVANGHMAGPYVISGGSGTTTSTYVSYTDHGQHYESIISSGTVTLANDVGNIGDPVIGSFSAIVSLSTSSTNTLAISGTFNVKRAN